jgi:hypothetical protein
MLTIKNKRPEDFRLPEQRLSDDELPIAIPSNRHDAKPFVVRTALSTFNYDV